jgi:hypothetical protein
LGGLMVVNLRRVVGRFESDGVNQMF